MDEQTIANALTSGMLGPMVGSVLVLVTWIAAKYQDGVPLAEQWRAMLPTLRGALIGAAGTAAPLLIAGRPWMESLVAGLTVAFALLNLRATKPAVPPAQ